MVGLIDDSFKQFPLNSRIRSLGDYGTVRYVGEVRNYNGLWIGVEWDDPHRGKHDGSINGVRYFQTAHPTSGSMIRPEKAEKFQSLQDAVRERYLQSDGDDALDAELLKETQSQLHAPLFEIVGMDKVAKRQSNPDKLKDVSVAISTVNTAGGLSSLTCLTTLNISSTLVWNWQIVAEITMQIPTLFSLNLSSNKLILPSEEDIQNLEPHFRHITYIDLSKNGLKDWRDVLHVAQLWPNIEQLSLQENGIEDILPADCMKVFKNLRELHLSFNKLSNFVQICKLGNIKTLERLFLVNNNIENVELPDCDYNEKVDIFPALNALNLCDNPISDSSDIFNELDKLPMLKSLCKTPKETGGFDDMFTLAVASISQLQKLSKAEIPKEERRGAEYEIWRKHAKEWLQTENDPKARKEFCKAHRSYPNLVKKYGSPVDFLPKSEKKASTLVKVRILNQATGETFEKKVPRQMSLQALLGLIIKRFHLAGDMPKLSYKDAQHPTLIVPLENMSKNLDFYSIQDGDTVVVE